MTTKILNSRPMKMWIDGKIFHIQALNKNKKSKKKQKEVVSELKEVEQEEISAEEQLKLLDIKEDGGKFSASFKLPKLYYSKIQNLPDFSIDKVCEETKTKILLPKAGQDGELSIESEDTSNLVRAVSHIHSAIGEIRAKNVPLQLVCIPCLSENIKERFENLKSEILSMENEIKGLHESIFMCPSKLHITVDVYALLDDREKAEAIKALSDYKTNLVQTLEAVGPLKLDITGLDIMNDNVKKVDVLYANIKMVDETEEYNLQKIVNDISTHFYNRGLAKRYQDNVKLHMTVINTKYRKDHESPKRKRRRQSIDATKILEKFKDYSFGHCDFDSLHLSYISVKGEDGFYKPLAVIKLDSNKEVK